MGCYDKKICNCEWNEHLQKFDNYPNHADYVIHPQSSYRIIRNCPGCGCKTSYVNTGNFRVNANGNRVDIWLIYQCEKCRHTYNVTLYERVSPSSVGEDFRLFQENSRELALRWGCDKGLFQRNRAEIDLENIEYTIVHVRQVGRLEGNISICIRNPFELKIRTEKVLAEILEVSRSRLKSMIKEGRVEIQGRYIGRESKIEVRQDAPQGPLY
ncbi:DUF1062 domain-containing protein [Murimonas intestini]|uniref:DUF1062 domain-containing protein n=1 Tax=Murimonas intestini TaxID=1337051 RepID=A0AB73SXQ8_9FIRM|nr:DUF1062 domain-containing protein [Murimonas intestini]MCR1843359.1 DUF1062 domain-containing protein [Murimonas intestini]MCR1868719.1 DUF1062 domain-containing protein [Murimonas intestini]MCR1886333.1 DUF1062 domain-containing protein [Murimonas intestini]